MWTELDIQKTTLDGKHCALIFLLKNILAQFRAAERDKNIGNTLANCSDVSTHQQLTRRRPIGMGAPLVPASRVHRTSWRGVLVVLEHRASCRPVYLLHLAKMLRILKDKNIPIFDRNRIRCIA